MSTPTVSLTFDNGPTPHVTPAVLDVLDAHGVPATFFAIGNKLATPDGLQLGRRVVAAGHRLGGHTWSHDVQFGGADAATINAELERTRTTVEAAGGEPLLFRPYGAGGVIDGRLMNRFGAEQLCSDRYTCVLWNVLPGDWRDQQGWVEAALNGIARQAWAVVVLHDIADAALPRLEELLSGLNSRVTWSQEFPDECTPIRNGVPTSSFDMLLATT